MNLGLSLEQSQKLEQRQILSQRLIQSMELLQLPLQELEERVKQELSSNPVLESEETEAIPFPSSSEKSNSPQEGTDEFERASQFSDEYPDTIDEERPFRSRNAIEDEQDWRDDQMANLPSYGETLQEALLAQLVWHDTLSPQVKMLCEKIIWYLDHRGRIPLPQGKKIEDLHYIITGRYPTNQEQIDTQEALRVVRSLEPKGIGGCSAVETLLLQLDGNDSISQNARTILKNCAAELENNRLPQIAKKMGITLDDVEEAIHLIQTLNPYPAAKFDLEPVQQVTPDVIVERNENGNWTARMEEKPLFRLRISPEYKAQIKSNKIDTKAKKYLRHNIGSAQWFIDAIAARRKTILSVAQAIVDYQKDFFELGPEHLRPLKMQQIADVVGVHIATVSRTCDDKWMASPAGIFPFKKFFSRAVSSSEENGEQVKDRVQERIRGLILEEDKKNPLSDEELVALLKKEGIHISRRTVAKYRDAMRIPSSRSRKQW